MQRDNEIGSAWRSTAWTFLAAGICLGNVATAQQSGGAFKLQVPVDRSPEDVALHPFVPHPSGGTGGGVAVVRASQRDLTGSLLPASNDDIVVIRTLDGVRANLLNYGQGNQLTAAFGASDLVDVGVNISCSVLIGQRHFGGDPSTFRSFIDVVDLSNTYAAGANCTLRWISAPGFGYVHDVEIQEPLCFAVVNHKNEARVVDLLPSATLNVGIPLTDDSAVVFADPTYQRNSVAVTRSSSPAASHRAVVTTCRKFLTQPQLHPVVQVSVLDLTATGATEALRWSPDPALAAHEPFDLAITPNDQLAVVVANDAFALFDLAAATPATLGTDITTNGVVREYSKLARAMVVTDTYAVTLGAINGGFDWQADVYAISATGTPPLKKVHTLTGTGQPHDIDRSTDGAVVVIRTTEDVVVLKNVLSPSILRTDVASASLPMTRDANGIQYDSIAISRKWAEQTPGGGPVVVRHYAVVLGKDPAGTPAGSARVDLVDLTFGPSLVESWQLDSLTGAPVVPASLRMLPGGQMVSICAAGEPHNLDPNDPNTPVLDGTDAWVFDLRADASGTPIGSVFHCERQGWPQVTSDPLEAIGVRSVSLSRDLTIERGFIHTIEITNP